MYFNHRRASVTGFLSGFYAQSFPKCFFPKALLNEFEIDVPTVRTGIPAPSRAQEQDCVQIVENRISEFSTVLQDSTRIFLSFFFIEEAGKERVP
jgi:hypothetical protein